MTASGEHVALNQRPTWARWGRKRTGRFERPKARTGAASTHKSSDQGVPRRHCAIHARQQSFTRSPVARSNGQAQNQARIEGDWWTQIDALRHIPFGNAALEALADHFGDLDAIAEQMVVDRSICRRAVNGPQQHETAARGTWRAEDVDSLAEHGRDALPCGRLGFQCLYLPRADRFGIKRDYFVEESLF